MASEPLFFNGIESLARALLGHLAPLTGTRATGTVSVTAPSGGGDIEIARNTYALPVVDGQQRETRLYKVAANPATTAPNGTGGAWPIADGATEDVGLVANLGGARFNLEAGTAFRFDPQLASVSGTFPGSAFVGGADLGGAFTLKDAVWFEDLSSAAADDIFKAKVANVPGVVLAWVSSAPTEGRTTGMRQGSTRGGRRVRFMRETFALYVVTARLGSDTSRRQEGTTLLEAITRLLSDRQQNDDGEQLSSVGAGVEITDRTRFLRSESSYIYAMRLRCNRVLIPIDSRTYSPWELTRIQGALPGRETPEPTDPIEIVDVTDPMP